MQGAALERLSQCLGRFAQLGDFIVDLGFLLVQLLLLDQQRAQTGFVNFAVGRDKFVLHFLDDLIDSFLRVEREIRRGYFGFFRHGGFLFCIQD